MKRLLISLFLLFSACLNAQAKAITLSGSTRIGSYNQSLAVSAAHLAASLGAETSILNIKDYNLPFYNADLEKQSGMPPHAKALKHQLLQNDLIIIASPEYNHSVSAILKNALDWISRGEQGGFDRAAFKGKHFLLISTSPGTKGGARGLTHLRDIIEDLGATVLPETLALPRAHEIFNAEGELVDPVAKRNLQQLIQRALNS